MKDIKNMIDILLGLWLLLFIAFLVISIITNNEIFGLMAGFLLLLLGLFILVDGIQISNEMSIVANGSTTEINYVYNDLSLPYGTVNTTIGLPLLLFSIYLIYANLIARKGS